MRVKERLKRVQQKENISVVFIPIKIKNYQIYAAYKDNKLYIHTGL